MVKIGATGVLALLGVGVAAFVGYRVYKAGGVSAAAAELGAGAVNAAGSVVAGGVGAVGASVGLPTPAQTTTDASVARWVIDNVGHFEASKWAGAPAYLKAITMPAGSGTPPPPGTDLARQFAGATATDTGDETARLASRYPAPAAPREPSSIFDGAGSFGEGAGLGSNGFGGLWTPGYTWGN